MGKLSVKPLLLLAALLTACTPDYDERYHVVGAVTDDGALQLNDGVRVTLAGLDATTGSRAWLRDHLTGRRVRLAFDTRHYPETTESGQTIRAYVLTEDGASVNGYLAGAQLAPVSAENVDSTAAFRAYAAGQRVAEPGAKPPAAAAPVPENETETASEAHTPATLSDLADRARPAVGLVLVRDGETGDIGQGTAFLVRPDGLAVTNYHVLAGADKGILRLSDGRELSITEWVDASERYDYAIFRVEKTDSPLPYLPIAPTTPRQAEEVYVIGNPSGLTSTFTRGVVSALRPKNDGEESPPDALIQIDAAISPGSSGSPVLNRAGEVVGLASYGRRGCADCNFAYNIRLLHLSAY